MSELYSKSIQKLELDAVLELLSACAESDGAKAVCNAIRPVTDPVEVQALLDETTAACSLRNQKGSPSFSGIYDITDCVERADRGGCLHTRELLSVGSVLRCTRMTKDYHTDVEQSTVLSWMFQELIPNKFLEDRIFSVIVSEDEIADAASAALSDIRRHMRIQSARIKDSLQKVITFPAYSKLLREPIITIRQGRYVVPVKSECKNELPGLVHDVSATGSTYFVEPMSVVNANNALRELELSEKNEIERILLELSAAVAAHKEGILQSYAMLTRLDVIFAKARLAEKMKAFAPDVNDQGIIELHNARHPLIAPETVVPISVWIGKQFDTMIITGPNTGGKTVTLKTVGLLTLMAECGLHIPAREGSSVSTFGLILADIGDEQSIAQNLSTFSSHMRTIVDIVDRCDSNTLVLFDELGAGTDPAEGAALAIALIEHCRKLGGRVIATTHYAELKLYAMRTEGVTNASCEFDVETLQPTYRLLIGFPGKSNAFAISKKLGLSENIIKNASDLIGKNDKDFENVLSQLEEQRRQMELARQEAEHLRRETEKVKRQSEEYSAQLRQEREKAMEEARREAKQIIDDARRMANEATEELKQIKKQLSDNGDTYRVNQRQIDLRKKLNDAESNLRTSANAPARPAPSREIMIGDTVELLKLGTKANVLAINKDGTYQLQAGILKLTAKESEIYLLEAENPHKNQTKRPAHSGREMNLSAVANEVDLRGMDSIEAVCVMERYLDEAMRSNVHSVRIIHGKGTGVLRAAVHQSLKKNKFVKKFRLGAYGEGEDGVTIAEFV